MLAFEFIASVATQVLVGLTLVVALGVHFGSSYGAADNGVSPEQSLKPLR